MTSPENDHAYLIIQLLGWLIPAQQRGHGTVRTAPSGVVLDGALRRENAPEPDVFFIASEHAAMLAGSYTEGIPDLVIEVLSSSTRRRDLPGGKKWDVYERFSVPRYWIVDPRTRTVAQYSWQDGKYQEPTLRRAGAVLESSLVPGIRLPVTALFAGVRQPEIPLHGLGPFALPRSH